MKLNKIIPTIISLFSFFAIIMNAQEQLNLRLDDCISLAIENNKKITIAQARMQSAQAKVDESNSAMLPQLRLNSRAALLSKVDEFTLTLPLAPPEPLFPSITHNYSVKLSLHQPVFMGFRLQKAKEMNEYNAAGAMEDYSKDIADLKFEVTSAYWNYFRAIRTNVTMEKSLELVSQLLKDIKELMNQGMATEADVLKIETRLSDVTLQKISIENNVRLSAMSLNNLIGKPLETKLVLSESIDTTLQKRIISTEEMNLPSLLSNAVQKRPELKSIALKKQMSEAGISAAQGGWYPQVLLSANYELANPNQRYIPPKDKFNSTWDFGVVLQWDIWNWNQTGSQTEQAIANKKQIDANESLLHNYITLEVSQCYYQLLEARQRIGVAARGVSQAKESYRNINEKFKRGLTTNSEVLEAQVTLTNAELNQTNAIMDYYISEAKLKRACGENK